MGAVARGARGGDEVGPLAATRSRPGGRGYGPPRPRRGELLDDHEPALHHRCRLPRQTCLV